MGQVQGQGTGPIDAFVDGLSTATGHSIRVLDYHEHAVGSGASAQAVAYLELRIDEQQTLFGVGMDVNIVAASLKAILSGLQRAKIAGWSSHAGADGQASQPGNSVANSGQLQTAK